MLGPISSKAKVGSIRMQMLLLEISRKSKSAIPAELIFLPGPKLTKNGVWMVLSKAHRPPREDHPGFYQTTGYKARKFDPRCLKSLNLSLKCVPSKWFGPVMSDMVQIRSEKRDPLSAGTLCPQGHVVRTHPLSTRTIPLRMVELHRPRWTGILHDLTGTFTRILFMSVSLITTCDAVRALIDAIASAIPKPFTFCRLGRRQAFSPSLNLSHANSDNSQPDRVLHLKIDRGDKDKIQRRAISSLRLAFPPGSRMHSLLFF